ncbi:MAG: PAS domain-containing protein [Candidatus Aminicenantes bacterium]
MPDKILNVLIETIPIEFSVLDADDKVLAWNKHDSHIFKRPESVIGKDVRDCHPENSLDKVETIIQEMKEGSRNKARFWIDLPVGEAKSPNKILIEYYALRDEDGTYLGCVEVSQNIQDFLRLEGQKRLLD